MRFHFGPRTRKAVLALHLLACLGWMGGVVCFIVLDVTTATSQDANTLRASYIALDLITAAALVPLAGIAFWSGVFLALGTSWGLFRHWWVIAALVLTMASTTALAFQGATITKHANLARDAATPEQLQAIGSMVPFSVGLLVVLGIITLVTVFKPGSMTGYGRRKGAQAPREVQ